MTIIAKNGNTVSYGIKHYIADTETDRILMPTVNEQMGTTCFVIDTSKYYMLNSQKAWIEIQPYGVVSSTSPTNVVYEGGRA